MITRGRRRRARYQARLNTEKGEGHEGLIRVARMKPGVARGEPSLGMTVRDIDHDRNFWPLI
jgi:hypothetical protein